MVAIHVTDRSGKKQTLQAPAKGSLMEVLREHDFGIDAICGGCCACATCHVYIAPGSAAKLTAISKDEQDLVESSDSYKAGESRLSCQIPMSEALDGIDVTIAPSD